MHRKKAWPQDFSAQNLDGCSASWGVAKVADTLSVELTHHLMRVCVSVCVCLRHVSGAMPHES